MEKLEAREAHIAALERKAAQVTTLEQEVAELKQIVAQLVKTGKATQQASLEAQQPIASVGVAH